MTLRTFLWGYTPLPKKIKCDIIKNIKQRFLEEFMATDVENIIQNIDFSMKMEDMPLTEEDKNRLRNCIIGKDDIVKVLQETIKKYTLVEA
jgi:hypothetical protein